MPLVLVLALQAGTPAVQPVAHETMSAIDVAKQVVARDATEWAALWKQHAGATPRPAVDLGSRTVVAVFLGSRPSAGYQVEITGTREKNGVLFVLWQERRPDPGDVTAQILTSPAVIATVPKFAGEIRFEQVPR